MDESNSQTEKRDEVEIAQKLNAATQLLVESERENEKLKEKVEQLEGQLQQLKSRNDQLEAEIRNFVEGHLATEFMRTRLF